MRMFYSMILLLVVFFVFGVAQTLESTSVDVPLSIATLTALDTDKSKTTDTEWLFLEILNDYRNASDECWNGNTFQAWTNSDRTVIRDLALDAMANFHSKWMADNNCFAHACAGEPDLRGRFNQFNAPMQLWGSENIAAGNPGAQATFEQWRTSTMGHNENMLDCRAKAIGVSAQFGMDSQFGWYWTTNFSDLVGTPASDEGNGDEAGVCFELDKNGNNRIDDDEILGVIELWIRGALICQ